jgi:hypothetical protein
MDEGTIVTRYIIEGSSRWSGVIANRAERL